MKLFQSEKVDFQTMQKFKSTYGRSVDIHFLGLWDAVSTFGWIYDPVFLPYTTNNRSVQAVRHAVAIDERRSFFRNMPWGNKYRDAQDKKEVWFSGVHSDVGGGYPESESGLAKITLKWIIDEACTPKFGLVIDQTKYDRYVLGTEGGGYAGPDSSGCIHQSLKGAWRFVQRLPRRVWVVSENREDLCRPDPHRIIEPGSILHHSVLDRMRNLDYRPASFKGRSVEEIESSFEIEGP